MAVIVSLDARRPDFIRHLEVKSAQLAQEHFIARNIGRKAGWSLRKNRGNVTLRNVEPPSPDYVEPPSPDYSQKPAVREIPISRAFAEAHGMYDGQEMTATDGDGAFAGVLRFTD